MLNIVSLRLLGLCLLTLWSCGNSGDKSAKQIETSHTQAIVNNPVDLPYKTEFFTLDSSTLSIKVFSMPELFDLESLESRAQMKGSTLGLKDMG